MLLQLDFHKNNINSNNADDDINDNDNYNTTNSKKHQQEWLNHVNDMEVCDLVLTNFWHIHVHPFAKMVNPGGWGTPYNGLYGEDPRERGTFFCLQVYKRVGISQV